MGLDKTNPVSRLAERIENRLAEIGRSATSVSRDAGKGPDFIRDFLTGRKISMSADAMARIARELGVTVAWLQGDDTSVFSPIPEASAARTVAVFGSTPGESAGFQYITSQVVEMLPCPPGLAGVRDAFALYVGVATMEPRFRQGELIFITPHRPPSAGDDVVVTLVSESGKQQSCIAQFSGERDGKIGLRQHNPPLEMFLDRDKIVEIRRISPINDLIGR